MTAAYFHGAAHPDLSLLTVGRALGYSVLALDRPGYGRSATELPEGQSLQDQAETVYEVLDNFAASHDIGEGVFVLAHSYGYKVALHLAAHRRGRELLGIAGSGSVYRYMPELDPASPQSVPETNWDPRELFWGPADLYPPGTFDRGMRPTAPVPVAESLEAREWMQLLPPVAARVRVPLHFSVAEHEKWWQVDDHALTEYRNLFTATPRMVVRRQPRAGHNISLGWAARAYHLSALAFAAECVLTRTV